jgi:putative transposase
MPRTYKKSGHVKPTYNVAYHLVWCPKYRRPVLEGPVYDRLKVLLHEYAGEHGFVVSTMEIMPDHVHLFVKTEDSRSSPHKIVRGLKGYTSRILRQEFESLRTRLPTLWTRGYYCESIGSVSQEAIERYIQDQKGV